VNGRLDLGAAIASRKRAEAIAGLRGLARPARPPTPPAEHCDLCGNSVPSDHRHLLNLEERKIVCTCESCWALRSGDAAFRPVGMRTLWLEDFWMPDELWAGFQLPIGLAFFLRSSVTDSVVAMYPSPAGATESELHFASWGRLVALNPVLDQLEADAEALVVNRLSDPPAYAIAPIDRCYALVGLIKKTWRGISGGPEVERAIAGFFDKLRADALAG
jgi:Family of unknown function (DUF5947)